MFRYIDFKNMFKCYDLIYLVTTRQQTSTFVWLIYLKILFTKYISNLPCQQFIISKLDAYFLLCRSWNVAFLLLQFVRVSYYFARPMEDSASELATHYLPLCKKKRGVYKPQIMCKFGILMRHPGDILNIFRSTVANTNAVVCDNLTRSCVT